MSEPTELADREWFSNDAATFGDRVAAAREVLGLDQSDLARKLGVKLKTVQGWENDLSEPRANKLQMLAGVLNVSLVWLLNGEGEGIAPPGTAPDLSRGVIDLLSDIRQIRAQLTRAADQLTMTEKRLRKALKEKA